MFNIGRAQNIIIYSLSYNSFLYLHIWLHFEIMAKTEYFTSWTVMLAEGEGKMPPPLQEHKLLLHAISSIHYIEFLYKSGAIRCSLFLPPDYVPLGLSRGQGRGIVPL